MKMKMKVRSILAIVSLAGLLALTPNSAIASISEEPNAPDPAVVRAGLADLGIDPQTVDSLVDKLFDGELLDSQTNATPVETITDENEVRQIYADGSVRVMRIEPIPDETGTPLPDKTGKISAMGAAISQCTKTASGSGYVSYSGCRVELNDGITILKFNSGYTRATTSASVHGWGSASAATSWGSVTAAEFTYTRANATSTIPAQVQVHTKYTHWSGLSSEDIYLNLFVSFSSAWVAAGA